ncbi:PREDICTED: leishmanolysin-like peptidase [Priapulus caudatus]|uniref:Leishmanolysin-like peptidase n=1 Tax=Priapulus caudatus TaxID=37621 RepID=A0ABM1ER03_PRICU|nr:PREDICTED: leishmanolysin-like peptidase [Priapulus caudatus]
MAASYFISYKLIVFDILLLYILPGGVGFPDHVTCNYVAPSVDEVIDKVYIEPDHVIRKRSIGQRLRIKLYYDKSVDRLPVFKQDVVKGYLLPHATHYWQQTLSVRETAAAIRLNRACAGTTHIYKGRERFCMDECANVTRCGEVVVPREHLRECNTCTRGTNSCRTLVAAPGEPPARGVADADYILYVSAVHNHRCDIGTTVAFSAHCQLEAALDRPIAGHVNLCPEAVSAKPQEMEVLLSTVKHEILHALGFSIGLFAFFRNDDGIIIIVIISILIIISVRRLGWKVRGREITRTVQLVVTPRVRAEARRHFNCSTLEGAELEDQGVEGTKLTHWEKRVFENDAMTGTHTQNPIFSRITLALMEDTGWYRVDYSMAQPLAWGRNLGCDFVKRSCKEWMDTRPGNIHPFCNKIKEDPLETDCTRDREAVAICNIVEYQSELKTEYQVRAVIPGMPGIPGTSCDHYYPSLRCRFTCDAARGLIVHIQEQSYRCHRAGQRIYVRQLFNDWLHEGSIICPPCDEVCQRVGVPCPAETDAPAARTDMRRLHCGAPALARVAAATVLVAVATALLAS